MLRKFGFLLLSIFCLTLGGCFHIPDKDRILSNNSKQTETKQAEIDEFYQSLDTLSNFMQNINNEDSKIAEDIQNNNNLQNSYINNENIGSTETNKNINNENEIQEIENTFETGNIEFQGNSQEEILK